MLEFCYECFKKLKNCIKKQNKQNKQNKQILNELLNSVRVAIQKEVGRVYLRWTV